MVDLIKSLFLSHCCQNHNLTCKLNVVNVLLGVSACPMFFAPSAPISLDCEWLISVKSVFSLYCCQNHNLTPKFNSVNVWLPMLVQSWPTSLSMSRCRLLSILGLQIRES